MKGWVLVSVFILITACSVTLTEGGRKVFVIPNNNNLDCTPLGEVEASFSNGTSIDDDRLQATKLARNKVAEMGGNAMVITDRASDIFQTTIIAYGFRCETRKSSPNVKYY